MSIFIKSSDSDELFEVNLEASKMIATVSDMLEDFGDSAGSKESPIMLPNVNSRDLSKVIKYCEYHYKDKKEEEKKEKDGEISAWDQELCDVPQSELFSLIMAANFLHVNPLLNVTCKTVANMIKGKSAEEIRTTFNIKNDFTKEEEEKIEKENEWILNTA